jgi:ABC-type Fe3+-hydroxamate transport system substrate-binding protein
MLLALYLLCLRLPVPTSVQANAAQTSQPIYAVLGPEAPAILRILVGNEHVIALQPGDLAAFAARQRPYVLIVPEQWAHERDLSLARQAGVKIVTVARQNSVTNIIANIQTLGALTGQLAASERWVNQIEQGLRWIGAEVGRYPAARVLVLSPEGYTQGRGALITDLIERAGGINTAAEAGIPEALQIEDAHIRDFDPDVVLLVGWDAARAHTFAADPLYKGLRAFDRHHVYQITPPGKDPARLVEDVQALADLLHPPIL